MLMCCEIFSFFPFSGSSQRARSKSSPRYFIRCEQVFMLAALPKFLSPVKLEQLSNTSQILHIFFINRMSLMSNILALSVRIFKFTCLSKCLFKSFTSLFAAKIYYYLIQGILYAHPSNKAAYEHTKSFYASSLLHYFSIINTIIS